MVLLLITSCAYSSLASACTAVYIGKKVSADGTTMLGRSEDLSSFAAYNKMYLVVPKKENAPGRIFKDANGLRISLPPTTYKYTTLSNGGSASPHTFPAVCTNEKGLTITATVDAYVKKEAVLADPYITSGLRENSLAEVIAQTSATAKEGVLKLGNLMETKGLTEAYVVFLADQKETWMMELYTGHQWAAVRLPEDKALVMGNQFMFDTLSNISSKDFLHSKELFTLPERKGFAVKENGKLHLGKTYGKKFFTYNNGRTWIGQKLLAPKQTDEQYNPNRLYPFLFTPDKKVKVEEVMELYRNRYEGTRLDAHLPANKNIRVIGTSKQQEVHIIQIDPAFPSNASAVQWLCLANAEHSIFVPSFSNIENTLYPYKVTARTYSPQSAYWQFQKVAAKGNANRDNALGKNIRAKYKTLELDLVKDVQNSKTTALKLYKKAPLRAQPYMKQQSDAWARKALGLNALLTK